MERLTYASCSHRHRRFDVDDNKAKSWLYHPRGVDIDEGEHWCNWDEFLLPKDDPGHADGFIWSFCEDMLDDAGYRRKRHQGRVIALPQRYPFPLSCYLEGQAYA
jgi:hypothetical protein